MGKMKELLQKTNNVIKTTLLSIWGEIKDIWNRGKIFFIIIGGAILAFEFKNLQMWYLAYSSKKELQSAVKTDAKLATQETQDKTQADALVQQADSLTTDQPNTDPDWYKK
jgi:hypothetical protein